MNHTQYLTTIKKIKELDEAFTNSKSLVSEEEYHNLYFALKQYEVDNPSKIRKDSPTQLLSKDNLKGKDIKHKQKMLSLDKEYDVENIINFFFKIGSLLKIKDEELEIIGELKLDGVAISVFYEYGMFKHASTRGDGDIGKDVTETIKLVSNIPKLIKELKKDKFFEVHGELFIDQDNFSLENYKLLMDKYSDRRSAISGLVRSIVNPDKLIRDASFIAFKYTSSKNYLKDTIIDDYKTLVSLGFRTQLTNLYFVFKNKAHFFRNPISLFTKKREHFPFDIDGVVFKVNNKSYHNKIGETNHHPKWALAYKFIPKKAVSKLLSIEWNLTNTNLLCPVAIIEPVKIDNSLISRINLHNYGIIKSLNLKINSIIEIERRGDVVPKISRVIENGKNTKEIIIPITCPKCNKTLYSKETTVLYCKHIHKT